MFYKVYSCLSLDSYIKPQLTLPWCSNLLVVYLLIPTSNHNCRLLNIKTAQLFISWFLHQTTTDVLQFNQSSGCLSLDSYIKPQQRLRSWNFVFVVYLLIPTSNHNLSFDDLHLPVLFISWFLHQTTTCASRSTVATRCLSLDSYIKPQRLGWSRVGGYVVYLLIPTSNHNRRKVLLAEGLLFISWFLHQTTTGIAWSVVQRSCLSLDSYIKPQPKEINANFRISCLSLDSYIKPQLGGLTSDGRKGCLSLDSYIKPQRRTCFRPPIKVVYLLIPTSNHNCWRLQRYALFVVYLLIPTSNHNSCTIIISRKRLFISWFLHQTTTSCRVTVPFSSCLSLDSYIKPQRLLLSHVIIPVVYLLIPTSNHNLLSGIDVIAWVVYLLIPTSNHNLLPIMARRKQVVYLLIPTSNHNSSSIILDSLSVVYLLIPTSNHNIRRYRISRPYVVYLLIPTSNHNLGNTARMSICCLSLDSYIKPQLHTPA